MPISVTCACGKKLTAPDEAAGQRVRCPACNEIIGVPGQVVLPVGPGAEHEGLSGPRGASEMSFPAEFLTAFAYPLSIRGILALVASALVISLVVVVSARLPMPGSGRAVALLYLVLVAVVAYLLAYLGNLVISSAEGERETPDWPAMNEFLPVLVRIIFPLALLFFAPLVIIAAVAGESAARINPAVFIAINAAACVYLPMALAAVLVLRSFLAVSPHVVVPAILRAPAGVLASAALMWFAITGWGAINARVAAWATQRGSLVAPLAGHFVADLAAIYLLMVAARVIGINYWTHRREIGWFERV